MPLTPADVRNKQFSTTRLRPGYDEEEVDAFLDEVEAELDRLIQDNDELRAKLAEVLRGGKTPVGAGLNAPHVESGPDLMAAEPPRHEPERRPEPVMMKPVEFRLDLVEEGIHFLFVIAGPEPGRAELLVPHIRGRQWHLVVSLSMVPYGRYITSAAAPVTHLNWTTCQSTSTTRNSSMKLRSRATVPSLREGM